MDPAEIFAGSGSAVLTLADGSVEDLSRELRCEVLRDTSGTAIGYAAGFADALPLLGLRASVLLKSGFIGDGRYESANGQATVELILYRTEGCVPHGGCINGTYAASLSLSNNSKSGVVVGSGHRLDFECGEDDDVSLEGGKEIDITSPPKGRAYALRDPGYVVGFYGIECETDPDTNFLTVRTQPAAWGDPRALDRGYGFFASYQQAYSPDAASGIPVIISYDYFGTIVSGAPLRGSLVCGSSFAGTIYGSKASEDPELILASFQCP